MRENATVYIRRIEIRDLKLFRDLEISFTRADGAERMWTVVVGENGLGKTTFLQAIALAGVGPERGNQLAEIAALPDRRKKAAPRIIAELSVGDTPPAGLLKSSVELPQGVNLLRGGSYWLTEPSRPAQSTENPLAAAQAMRDPTPEWFIAGYGVNRQLPLALSAPEPSDRLLGRMEPLFDRGPMIATGFSDQLEHDLALKYAGLLKEALVDSGLLPSISNLVLTGKGGVSKSRTLVEANRFTVRVGSQHVRMPATWLSQGYQAMIAWIADLVGQLVLAHNTAIPLREMRGLVLVDELDLFVHPTWQLKLVSTLKRVFPHIQFVVTTHSPMVLPGLTKDEVIILEPDQAGNITSRSPDASPQLLTGSEIYDVFFGIRDLYPTHAARAMQKFALLAADPDRDEEEEAQLQEARAVLEAAGVDVDPPVRRRVRQ